MGKQKKIQTPTWAVNLQYIFLAIYLIIFGMYMVQMIQENVELDKPYSFFLLACILLFLVFTHVYYHEFAHFISAKICGYKAIIVISRKRKRKVCYIKGKIKPLHFTIIAIMPFVIDLLIYVCLLCVFPNLAIFASLFLVLAIGGASGDIWMFLSGIPWLFRRGYYLRNRRNYFTINKEKTN